jgi:hypothetical protein
MACFSRLRPMRWTSQGREVGGGGGEGWFPPRNSGLEPKHSTFNAQFSMAMDRRNFEKQVEKAARRGRRVFKGCGFTVDL